MSTKIGLFGYGVVARGFYQALESNPHLNAEIKKICIKNVEKDRNLPVHLFTSNKGDILSDPEIDIVIELIDDAGAAFDIVKTALLSGKAVISANKKMIAENIETIASWHSEFDAPFLYEAAVAGSIPIIQNLEQFFGQQTIKSVRGILNGSTNYILTVMREETLSFEEALKLAQKKGFAESDPTLDISGQDAMNKLIIIAYHAFGQLLKPGQIKVESITGIEDRLYQDAAASGKKIKSVASIRKNGGKFSYSVQPELLKPEDELYGVENEHNAIAVEGTFSGPQLYAGKGAGSLPTGSAVINDLALLLQGFRYTKYVAKKPELSGSVQ